MAMNLLSSSPHLFLHQTHSFTNSGIMMFSQTNLHLYVNKQVSFQIKSSLKSQVFEDSTNGIVCYKDENGEIICEGFDEGPRCHPYHYPLFPPRELSIQEYLEKRWVQILDAKRSNGSTTLVEGQTSCNESNTLALD